MEWSRFSGFSPLSGSHLVTDASETSFEIPDLNTGLNYYVQVKAANVCGQGPATVANPSCAAPSGECKQTLQCLSIHLQGSHCDLKIIFFMNTVETVRIK